MKTSPCWVDGFLAWYHTEHLHSAIRFVTPDDRHFDREAAIRAQRQRGYAQARQRTPERWPKKHAKLAGNT
ncbi:MAG: hypothetical protein HZB55_14105 [Deltaproteobacteria bacterium]|nr:hypothetical protein [Deltaproteobacteria bacterium]